MQYIIVSDARCLIVFHKIGRLSILRQTFGQIKITSSVAGEFNYELPEWVNIQDPVSDIQKGLLAILDQGEATSIALASELKNSLLLIDEIKGRKIAQSMGVKITVSLGVLLAAKEKGVIKEIKPILTIIRKTNFRISKALIEKVLILAGEV